MLILTEKLGIKFIPNWVWSDLDPKLFIPDPDPSNSSGSDRIQIHNTAIKGKFFLIKNHHLSSETPTKVVQALQQT
jgi:hypothetical protein